MKILITESQYKFILEQWWNDPKHPEWKKYAPTEYERRELKKAENLLNNMDPHKILAIFQIGTAFIPFVGPFISAGIGMLDAKLYWDEGDKTSAGIAAFFSILPGIGAVTSKIPAIKLLGQEGMENLSKKIISKQTQALTKTEIDVVNGISSNSDEVLNLAKTESNKINLSFQK